ncbi:MAG: anthranilate phosphoribosyltransferase family protein [Symploca sp. SIO2G7]|nr:anthranilate phosphoribosyltransferase family protein [Symploca sp. SIO2G7]
MSDTFREFLKKVGSGVHTSNNLSRQEAATATRMLLLQEATPAQIGAFLIAHRIKRPTSEELAGMLDAYEQIGPRLQPTKPVVVFGNPYDGRSRTAPVAPLTALILATAGMPVVMHGGDCMPTKYGVPLIEIWQGLGVDFSKLTLPQVEQLLEKTGFGFIYISQQFPQAQELVSYREQIGKRPPIATVELIWSPCAGDNHLVSGYVHPPTEGRSREIFKLRGVSNFTLVKGLEGSCDLPCDRTAIIALSHPDAEDGFERLLLRPSEHGFAQKEVGFDSTANLLVEMQDVLKGKSSPLMTAAIWNGGFYLWRCGVCPDLSTGFAQAETLFTSGDVAQKLEEISQAIASIEQSF